jgi:hypothetical protein
MPQRKGHSVIKLEQMQSHVMQLLEEHDIRYSWARRPVDAWAAIEVCEVHIPHIRSAISYATALHEIGHIKGRFQWGKNRMTKERWAWRWAEKNALVWTARMEADRRDSLAWAAVHKALLDVKLKARGKKYSAAAKTKHALRMVQRNLTPCLL